MSVKIHKILEGPFDFEDDDGPYYTMEVYVEYDGEWFDMELQSRDFNSMYDIIKHMSLPTIEPFIIDEPCDPTNHQNGD